MLNIHAVPARSDNYIWLIEHTTSKQVIIVDPGDAAPVITALERLGLTPIAILITHQHYDHINGVTELVKHYNLPVYGGKFGENDVITHDLAGKQQIELAPNFPLFTILSTPGHTSVHLSYLVEGHLFCGDTLFAAGCGRLLDPMARPLADSLKPAAAKQLLQSLSLLASLPAETLVYCTHEYTLANLHFAQVVEPNNNAIQQRLDQVAEQRANDQITLPSSIALERQTNPFLHCDDDNVIAMVSSHSGETLSSKEAVFFALRKWKDGF